MSVFVIVKSPPRYSYLFFGRQIEKTDKYKAQKPCDGCDDSTLPAEFTKVFLQSRWISANKKTIHFHLQYLKFDLFFFYLIAEYIAVSILMAYFVSKVN